MPVREIITNPHKTLRHNAKPVSDFGPELQQLIEDMVETMREAPGVGLAAPQVNVSQRVIVVEFGEEEDPEAPKKLYVFINPELTKSSKETEMGVEGCLSIPDFVGDVERAQSVTVKGLTRRGQPQKLKASGWLARIFQHEVDHVNGVLFIDRAEKIYRIEDLEDADEAGADTAF